MGNQFREISGSQKISHPLRKEVKNMEATITLMQSVVLLIPVLIVILTEAAKRIDAIPVSNKNAKWCVAALSIVMVLGWAIYTKSLNVEHALTLGVQAGVIYATAIGFYETVKNFIKKV
jgi:hypothetical protein